MQDKIYSNADTDAQAEVPSPRRGAGYFTLSLEALARMIVLPEGYHITAIASDMMMGGGDAVKIRVESDHLPAINEQARIPYLGGVIFFTMSERTDDGGLYIRYQLKADWAKEFKKHEQQPAAVKPRDYNDPSAWS